MILCFLRKNLYVLIIFSTIPTTSVLGKAQFCGNFLNTNLESSRQLKVSVEPIGPWSEQLSRLRFTQPWRTKLPNGKEFILLKTKYSAFNCHFYSVSRYFDFRERFWLDSLSNESNNYVDGFRLILSEYFIEIASIKVDALNELPENLKEGDLIVFSSAYGDFEHSGLITLSSKNWSITSKIGNGNVQTLTLGELLSADYYPDTAELKIFRFNGTATNRLNPPWYE